MVNRRTEVVLLLSAAALLTWGIVRAINRGDVAVQAWTTYLMGALLILSAANIFIRSRRIAGSVVWICGLFALIVLSAAVLSVSEGTSHKLAAVIQALLFFLCLGSVSFMQRKRLPPSQDAG